MSKRLQPCTHVRGSSCSSVSSGCLFHGATLPLVHTQWAVYAPVALQTPHTVHTSTGRLSALFVAILISYILLDLFFYGSSKFMLKTCLSMCLYIHIYV